MILTCPECSTNYMAKDGVIGPNGRSVRCASCETVWYVEGVDPDAMALEDNKTVLITSERESESQSESLIEPKKAPPNSVGAHILLRDKADALKLTKRKRTIRLIWGLPLTLLAIGLILALMKRQAIVESFPKSATLYQAIGLNMKTNGLDIEGLSSERLIVDGEDVLRVTGEVVNLTSREISVPLIQLRLENRSGEALADWYVEPGNIAAGGRVSIETDYPSPPIDGVELRFRFVPQEE